MDHFRDQDGRLNSKQVPSDGNLSIRGPAFLKIDYNCCVISRLFDKVKVPVGNFRGPIYMTCDFSNLQPLVASINSLSKKVIDDDLILKQITLEEDFELYSLATAITMGIQPYLCKPENFDKHFRYAFRKEENILSDFFQKGLVRCSETSLLAQYILQEAGFSVLGIGGFMYDTWVGEEPEKHSFLAFQRPNRVLIFDPVNWLNTNLGPFPNFSEAPVWFIEALINAKYGLVQCKGLGRAESPLYGWCYPGNITKKILLDMTKPEDK